MLSLIFPTQGNPIAALRTLKSTKNIVNEVVIGSVCIFEEDIKTLQSYKKEFNIRVEILPFNYIFENGFSSVLNLLASRAKNDMVLYLNVGEVIEKSEGDILDKVDPRYNAYYINHSVERHRWWRVFNRRELCWEGLIHEELRGEYRPYHKPLFTFADTEKDMEDPFKAAVYNDIKEICYWNQLIKLADNPQLAVGTDPGWVSFAKETYSSMKSRLKEKRGRYESFMNGDIKSYLADVFSDPFFEQQRFESSMAIEYQGDPMFLSKK